MSLEQRAAVAGPFTHLSTYHFFDIPADRLDNLRVAVRELGEQCLLKGTVLLSTEGINLFVAGLPVHVDTFFEGLKALLPACQDCHLKFNDCQDQPFNRWLVKLKQEIITMGMPDIKPSEHTVPHLPPKQLKAWLDEGRDMVLLDTRNDYEVALGTFEGAINPDIERFRAFPDAVADMDELKSKPVVIFCTGGIRCEKAGPMMQRAGFTEVYQLDGGILHYFETCQGAHYQGECFVFDKRVAVDASLQETQTEQCFACRRVVTADEHAVACEQGTCPCGSCSWPQ